MDSSTTNRVIPLDLLEAGETGHVHDVEGSESLVHRLSEMGIAKGVAIQMIKPGSPCILAISNHRLSLRTDDALQILVEVQS